MNVSSFSLDLDEYCNFNWNDHYDNKRPRIGESSHVFDSLFSLEEQDKDDDNLGVESSETRAIHGNNNVAENCVGRLGRMWVKERSNAWWEKFNSPDLPNEEFHRAFRMGKSTFDFICNELESTVAKKNTTLRLAIPVRQRVAVCIWRLATGESLRLVSKRFGLGTTTCHKLVLEVCFAMRTVLMPKFIHWPDQERMKQINHGFEFISGIPNVGGSMYTTHVPIKAPGDKGAANYLKWSTKGTKQASYSITIQGVVDPNGFFTDISIGCPGSMKDEKILENSEIYQQVNLRGLLNISSCRWIVGSSNYPLLDWFLVPYACQDQTWTQISFNEKIGVVEVVAKEAFARLKGRWSCLQKRTDIKVAELPTVLGACCVLHNICDMRGESLDPESKLEIFDDLVKPDNGVRSEVAAQARDQLAYSLLHENQNSSEEPYLYCT